ncbi:hypothetical protein LAZ67_8001346 [Cordylochernes scorpioides]|uniref:Uncharacterized protein n=1 Tax=Cordylochernes scorpioides TaxID=51811 RepID=A0ABY6KQ47_9ARAC|nr:hypothetical protein LAZ67_8001346 [Cordylochernes scorpioides]
MAPDIFKVLLQQRMGVAKRSPGAIRNGSGNCPQMNLASVLTMTVTKYEFGAILIDSPIRPHLWTAALHDNAALSLGNHRL